jgi:hypothetical protein
MLLEGLGGTKALRRSFRLVRHHWWKTFGTLFVAYLLTFVLGFVGSLIGAALGSAVGNDSALAVIVQQVVDVLTEAVTLPFLAAVVVVLYVDLRVRKEAFDLALLADHIADPGRPVSYVPAGRDGEAALPPADGEAAEPARHPAFGE